MTLRPPTASRTIAFRSDRTGPGVRPGHARTLARALDRVDIAMVIQDDRGRTVARMGRGVRSPLGWVTTGTPRVKPFVRAIIRSHVGR